MRNLLPLLGFLLLSCGQMQPGDEPGQALREQSGARLRRYWIRADDGAAAVISLGSFYDSKLGKYCQFIRCGTSETSPSYCLPSGTSQCPANLQDYVRGDIVTE